MINILILITAMASTGSPVNNYPRGDNMLITFNHCGEYTNVVFADGDRLFTQAVDFNRANHQGEVEQFIAEFNPILVTKAIVQCER